MQSAENSAQRQSDPVDPARANALLSTLGRPDTVSPGDQLPPFFHQAYFWSPNPPDLLGRDGHPRTGTGGVIPDLGLPRRMWAGGRLVFHAPFRAGHPAERVTTVETTARKQGRSGPLGFVTLRHEIVQGDQPCITEWQDLVYREDPDPSAPPPRTRTAREDENHSENVSFDSTVLFRYSALTFNGHRIHYDLDYTRDVEGYPGLVVHGPLLAQLLMLMAERQMGGLASFSFRATAPLFHFESATLCQAGTDFWVRGPDGRVCMEATATQG